MVAPLSLRATIATLAFMCLAAAPCAASTIGEPLPPWTHGTLDIHQIATGRGSSALIICPDGTSILIDAGATSAGRDVSIPPRPNDSRRPGEWIARYAQRHLRATGRAALDYFVLSHLHPDHVGDVGPDTPSAPHGAFRLTGITDVAAVLPIDVVVDRGFPDYAYPIRPRGGFALNYLAYIDWRTKTGATTERARAGAVDQIRLRHAADDFSSFAVRIVSVNGEVWSGAGDATFKRIPALTELAPPDYPDENMCSIALRLSFGGFDFYTGGDLACDTREGAQPWRDVETPVAQAVGPVEVAVANHHGYFDALGPEAVRALQPMVWIIPAWHLTHPNIAQLERMVSERVYSGPRAVFATDLMPATRLLNDRFVPLMAGTQGHVVVRVERGGQVFRVYVTDNENESDTVTAAFGPYHSR